MGGLVDGRFRSKSIILTSNRAMTDWPAYGRQAGALPRSGEEPTPSKDRLAQTSHQIVIKGQSYRKKLQVTSDED